MFQRFCLYLVFVFLLTAQAVSAKVDKKQFKVYKKAKKCYAMADYQGAQTLLAPLLAPEKASSLTAYAHFYYALAAYHQDDQALAAATFENLAQEFPTWDQRDEVLYWLAQLRFEQADYAAALAYLAAITDPGLAASIRSMKTYFLHRINDTTSLQTLLRQYPDDQTIAQVLLDKQMVQPFIKQDHQLIDTLMQRFQLSYQACKALPSLKKDSYNVAVFFPFFMDALNYEEENTNQFVLSLYKGILAAVDKLADQGICINLYAYDTQKSATTTAALLEQPEMKYMDLIIGPLYATTIPLVADFARMHQINVFNPLSVNAQVVDNNPFVYLFKPSLETQARKAAAFTQQDPQATQVGIVYGTSVEDSTKAFTYKAYIEHNTDQQVALMLQLEPEASRRFLGIFRNINSTQHIEKPSLDKLTHIYIASQDELIIANVLSAIEIMHLNPYIIGDEAWIRNNMITLDQLQRLCLRLIAPDYIDYAKKSLQDFRHAFYLQFGHYPSYYEAVGYDMMLFLGNMLAQHGVYFQQKWGDTPVPGIIFSGFCYGRHHDNQHVPMVKFQASALTTCEEKLSSKDSINDEP